MTATVDFVPFAASGGANVETQSAYLADSVVLANGYTSGIAQSAKVNKVLRQSSIISSIIAQYVAAITGSNVIDDGTTATILDSLAQAIRLPAYAIDTSATVNVLTAAISPVPSALVAGMEIEIKPAITNTGSATLNLNGLGAYPLINYSGALAGGELVAGQHYKCSWKASDNSWLVMTGAGITQTAADARYAALSSFVNSLGASGYQKIQGGLIIQWGTSAAIATNSAQSITFPIAFPTAVASIQLTSQTLDTGAGTTNSSATASSVTGFTLNNRQNNTATFFWFAIGY